MARASSELLRNFKVPVELAGESFRMEKTRALFKRVILSRLGEALAMSSMVAVGKWDGAQSCEADKIFVSILSRGICTAKIVLSKKRGSTVIKKNHR